MYRKIFISFLLIALINLLVSCYSSELVTVGEYNQIEEEDKPDDIRVITKDYQEFHFSESNFYVENDTLYGKVMAGEIPFEGKVAFLEIESIQVVYFDTEYSSIITVSQYQKIEAESGKPDEIYLTQYDNKRYHFIKNDYFIENDTLYGKGKLILRDREQPLDIKIALSEIESIEIESFNLLNTCLFSGGIVGGLVVAFILILIIVCTIGGQKCGP